MFCTELLPENRLKNDITIKLHCLHRLEEWNKEQTKGHSSKSLLPLLSLSTPSNQSSNPLHFGQYINQISPTSEKLTDHHPKKLKNKGQSEQQKKGGRRHPISEMAAFTSCWKCRLLPIALEFYLLIQTTLVCCNQYKVGDLDAWNIPSSANPNVYENWSKNHNFQLGDSLFFLYPPSQDSVLQVTPQSYASCNLGDPVLAMNDGNSVFNITCSGELYFVSGAQGHCKQAQKLQISVPGNVSCPAFSIPPAYGPSIAAFGPAAALPIQASSSPSPSFNTNTHPFCFILAATLFILVI